MMLGFLLARMGVDVVVLEKHADFLRDFRGDTIHPSTMEVMYELGILDDFLKRPHQKVSELAGQIGGETVRLADFSHLPVHCPYVALMPQWEFLNFIAEKAAKYPQFHLKMEAEVTDLIEEGGRVAGVRAQTPQGCIGSPGRSDCGRRWAPFRGARTCGLEGARIWARPWTCCGCGSAANPPIREQLSAASIPAESWSC